MTTPGALEIRRFHTEDDMDAVLALLEASLDWLADEHYRSFFSWKHWASPFGSSPAWVALDGNRVVGFRTFLRWEFERPGGSARAVRAVDTATHPDYQGRGIFSRLTRHALSEMEEEGVDFVFNTPNAQSLPGYLKMGWETVGRLPVSGRLRPRSLGRILRARVPADLWSEPTDAGLRAGDALVDRTAVERLLASQRPPVGLRTRRTAPYLLWRYSGFEPLGYRAVTLAGGVEEGIALFRLRRRGTALEAAVSDVLATGGDARIAGSLLQAVDRRSRADHVVYMGGTGVWRARFLPLPRQGPILTWRGLREARCPPLSTWQLTIGDVELF